MKVLVACCDTAEDKRGEFERYRQPPSIPDSAKAERRTYPIRPQFRLVNAPQRILRVCGDRKPIPKLSDLTDGTRILIGLTPSRWVARLQCLIRDTSQVHERRSSSNLSFADKDEFLPRPPSHRSASLDAHTG
jgi:hypothetical protein